MTPVLLASFTSSPPLLPRTWRGRSLFTADHTEAILDSLAAGVPLAAALRAVLGPTTAAGMFGRRKHDEADAAAALAAACEACPALAAEVARAESEGAARLRVDGVGGVAEVARGGPRAAVAHGEGFASADPSIDTQVAIVSGGGSETEHEGGEGGHAPQGAAAATTAQVAAWAERGQPATVRELAARLEAERAADASPYLVEAPAHPLTPPRRSPLADNGAPDWPRIRREALAYGPGPFGLFMWQEAQLTAAGFHGMSPWWTWTAENYFASMKRWLLALVGRGGAKSTFATRKAALAVDTDRRVPPGQTWIYPFVSVRIKDARNRLFEIKEVLERAYGITDTDADGHPAIDGKGMPKMLKVTSPEGTPTLPLLDSRGHSIAYTSFAATLGNVSGPNAIGATVDEEEKLAQDEDGKPAKANPSSEIIGSLIATFRARQGIRGTRISSAMTAQGSLYTSMREGPTLTNFLATIGARWLPEAVAGMAAVAKWEEEVKRDTVASAALRAHAASLRADSIMVPSWVANTMYGLTAESSAVALRIEVEGLPPAKLEGLTRAGYFMREYCSRPTGLADEDDGAEWAVLGDECRNAAEFAEDRGYE